ncbi:hypothetical protein ENUP19_0038G0021 [Entamoeba nuttalli]|uniref:Rab-GAP TBC domain-containing protein n=1 Tax=Entamoeba nuttalli TaxID=412467 RepID=A0ABQ0D9L3_9EUKA
MEIDKKIEPCINRQPAVILKRSVTGNMAFDIINNGDVNELKNFICNGGDVKSKNSNGTTTLMLACGSGNFGMVKVLLEFGKVNITDRDNKGRNCLHHLCLGRHESSEIFHIIQPRFLTQIKDNDGKIPLEYAVQLQLPLLVKLILDIDNYIYVKLCYDFSNIVIVKPDNANRYGFVVDTKEKSIPFILAQQTKQQIRQMKLRLPKWENMILLLKKGVFHPKFVNRLYKGMPDEVRSEVWKLLLLKDVDYETLKDEFNRLNQPYTKTPIDKQLDLDVKRTFQLHYTYKVPYGGNQKVLFNIFHALASRTENLEFTQGMTCAPSVLTLFLDEYSSYAGTVQFLGEKYRLKEMFNNFNLLTQCWNITRLLLQKRNPKLAQKLKQLGIIDQPLPFFIFDWHYSWFINAFNFELVLRIFDVIILEGFYALFSVADTVFHFLENEILNVQNINSLQQELKTPLTLLKQPPTVNQFMKYMEKHKIKSSEIDTLLKL